MAVGDGATVGSSVGVGSGLCVAITVGHGDGVSVQLAGNGVTPCPPEGLTYPIGEGPLALALQPARRAMLLRMIVAKRKRIMDVGTTLERFAQRIAGRTDHPELLGCRTLLRDHRYCKRYLLE